jgi:hypothetical protein
MKDICRTSPVVFKRVGTKIVEVESKLFKDIKQAVKDTPAAWEMWAYTKTSEFKKTYKDVEYDEFGEVTFPSLIKALGMEEAYNEQKDVEAVSRDYGFTDKTFSNQGDAINAINNFNTKESKFIAALQKEIEGYSVKVSPRTSENIAEPRQQSYNHALTNELINLLRVMGFDVTFATNPRYAGLFDPRNAKFVNGLLQVISIAKGESGEQALPEEFSHLIIEGLINNPLVQRLFDTLDNQQIKDILGDSYDTYDELYDGNALRLKKEAAGKLLAQYITKQGTIEPRTINNKRGLLGRIWSWAKHFFSKITKSQIDTAQINAHNAIADIYNLITTKEIVPLIDKDCIINADELYKLSEKFSTLEDVARSAEFIMVKTNELSKNIVTAGMNKKEKDKYLDERKQIADTLKSIQKNNVKDDTNYYYASVKLFLGDTVKRLRDLNSNVVRIKNQQDSGRLPEIKELAKIASAVRKIDNYILGYEDIISTIATFDKLSDVSSLMITRDQAEIIAEVARSCVVYLSELKRKRAMLARNVVLKMAQTQYKNDQIRNIGNKRDEVLAIAAVVDHADKDINIADRLFTAMSDADDLLLVVIDSLVKSQQYQRDMEMIEWNAIIAKEDKKLRDAGFTPDFMIEMKDGVPTRRIISPYDWEEYLGELTAFQENLRQNKNITAEQYYTAIKEFKKAPRVKNGPSRLIRVYVNPEYEKLAKEGKENLIPPDAIMEEVPNPEAYPRYANRIENLAPAQKEYYYKMMDIKRQMMTKIPHRGQGIYKTINISKDLVEGLLDNEIDNPVKLVKERLSGRFVRRPDDIGFGANENLLEDIENIVESEKDTYKAAEEIKELLQEAVDEDVFIQFHQKEIASIIRRCKSDPKLSAKEIRDTLATKNFYKVDTDFADHKIQRIPIYYTRRIRDPKMISTNFSKAILAYSAMAVNYEKMNEVVDILEVTRNYINNERDIRETIGNKSLYSKFEAYGKVYRNFVERAGVGSNIAGRTNDYIDTVLYEERKENEGSFNIPGTDVNLDVAKTLDAIKDYTGLLGLGLNAFSTFSNIAVGKVQQWIEAVGGEYFSVKDYAKAVIEYHKLLPDYLAEISSPVKKNKLSLLIQMFDPMGDYFESLKDPNLGKSKVSRILGGNSTLAFIGMNAGEHMLHCQTMLAILIATKLNQTQTDGSVKTVSLYDALEVVENNGIHKLKLQENLWYEKELIDYTGNKYTDSDGKIYSKNKNYGKPLKDENGRIKTERVDLKDISNNATQQYIFRKKRIIRKVNDSLNGAFNVNDKGAAHRKSYLRLVMQFRQWMPAHYSRRFAKAHYDMDLEQWREGYYRTAGRVMGNLLKDLIKAKKEAVKLWPTLSEHEKANLRRAEAEVSIFCGLYFMCRIGGKVNDKERSWWNKMVLYLLHRMKLEVGASMPNTSLLSNMWQLLQTPAAAITSMPKLIKVFNIFNMFEEVESGAYKGWSEWDRDAVNATPLLGQLIKAYRFDDSIFAQFEKND